MPVESLFISLPGVPHISRLVVISGGDGYEDYSSTGRSDLVGREDSTNHLLLWQM